MFSSNSSSKIVASCVFSFWKIFLQKVSFLCSHIATGPLPALSLYKTLL